jgi:hypothetical protein
LTFFFFLLLSVFVRPVCNYVFFVLNLCANIKCTSIENFSIDIYLKSDVYRPTIETNIIIIIISVKLFIVIYTWFYEYTTWTNTFRGRIFLSIIFSFFVFVIRSFNFFYECMGE